MHQDDPSSDPARQSRVTASAAPGVTPPGLNLPELSVLDWAQVYARLSAGVTVLTANKRLAQDVLARYARQRSASGETVWPRVDVLPWQAWCRRVLEAPLDEACPVLLSDAQSERLWRQVIAAAPAEWGGERLHAAPGQCARPAADAWGLLCAHGLDEAALHDQPDAEAQVLSAWISAYRQQLAGRGAIDHALLSGWLAGAFARGARALPETLILAGFHELPPPLQRLLAVLQEQGCALAQLAPPQSAATVHGVVAADGQAEAEAAAAWARARLLAAPQCRIGIVALDLSQRRAQLERVFGEVLQPAAALRPAGESERPFNISLGWPLDQEPVVHDALLALRWAVEALDFPSVSQLLRSPFLAVDEARQTHLELRLRDLNLARPSLEQVLFQAGGQQPTAWRSAAFAARWRVFRQRLRQAPRQGPLAWAELLAAALHDLGWGCADDQVSATGPVTQAEGTADGARPRSLSSREYQAVRAFHECLEQLATLQAVIPACGLGQIVSELQQLATRQIFQPQQNAAPILITEPLQALGLTFDHLWLMGASDDLWPEAPQPNPLLPHALQRRYGMAHATAAGELRYARTVTQWLLHSAAEVVCSWPRLSGDKALRPSPLLPAAGAVDAQDWLCGQNIAAATALRAAVEARDQERYEYYSDDQAPPLPPGLARGGAGVVQEQSACPFRALALHRWRVAPPQPVSGGLNAAQRGTLLHRALQALYTASEGALPAPAQWPQCAQQATTEALQRLLGQLPALADERLYRSEEHRLRRALEDWLAVDSLRAQPFRVVQQEVEREYTLGPLQLRLRVDRYDRLEDGTGVIIDYKSGQAPSVAAWFGARPQQPQLPLYALALGDQQPLAAVAFAGLKPGARKYAGLAREDGILPGVTTVEKKVPAAAAEAVSQWQDLPTYWHQVLSALAADYAAGYAAVDPRDGTVCQRCPLPPLCRIRDWQAMGDDASVEGGDAHGNGANTRGPEPGAGT